MARTFALRVPTDFSHMFDIGASVGANAVNNREDVLLVQYLLAVWMAYNRDSQLTPIIIQAPVVNPDGICGEKTKGAIKAFEKAYPNLVPDGRVDPYTSLASGKILWLNQLLFSAGGLRGGIPRLRVEFPQALVPSLFRP